MIIALTEDRIADVNKANQPFSVIGKIVPHYENGQWTYTEELFPEPKEKYYLDDDEDWNAYIGSPDKAIFLCYEDGEAAGQIILRRDWNHYAFIADISVAAAFRGCGVGTRLMNRAVEWAKEQKLDGLALETQDNNLLACRFYAKFGMEIGAVNTMLYKNAPKPWCDEIAVFWYLKFEK